MWSPPTILRHLMLVAACGLVAGCGPRPAPAASKADADFLRHNAHEPGMVVLASGLQYKVVRSGPDGGPHPAKGDEIKLDYTGSLVSGAVFDSTRATGAPAVLKMDGLVDGWMEALPHMRPGDEWILYVPPKLGYGAEGRPPVIPPDSVLVFDISLIGVLKTNAAVKMATAAG